MNAAIQKIHTMLDKSFTKNAWHGPSVLESLHHISPEESFTKLPNTHSIIELVAHMTTWRTFVTRRLLGDTEFDVTNEMNFPAVTDWDSVLNGLLQSQRDLLHALEQFPEIGLTDIVAKRKYDFYTLLHGIIQHDIYHTGQIILLRKLR